MNVEKNIRFLVDKLNLLGPDYIHKIDKNIKWKDFENKNVEECIKDEIYLDEKSQHDKYFNKRTKQFSNVAKLLLIRDDFIKDVLDIADRFQLLEIAFGIQKTKVTFLTETHSKKYEKHPGDYLLYNYEVTKRCLDLWNCWIQYNSYKYLETYKQNIRQNYELFKKSSHYKKIPSIYFKFRTEELLSKYGLSNIWEDSITLLLITGRMFIPDNFCPINLTIHENKITLSIPIYKETQLEDIKYKWNQIKKLKKEYLGYENFKSHSNIDQIINLVKEKTEATRYWDLIDLEAFDIPYDAKEEMKAYQRIRKAGFRLKKAAEELKQHKREGKSFIETLAEFSGIDNATFKL